MQEINFFSLDLNIYSLVPTLILVAGATLILIIDLIKKLDKGIFVVLSLFTLFCALYFLAFYDYPQKGFFDTLVIDGLSLTASILIILGAIAFLPLALTKQNFKEYKMGEYYALFLYMIAGFSLMASSTNLILIFVALELASLALYTLIALHNTDKSLEAAIKYFVLGSISAGFFAFGVMIFYLITGAVDIDLIKKAILLADDKNLFAIIVGFVFILASIGFKLSLVPFHAWAPDVYEGASAALAGFVSIVPKIAGFVVAIRFFEFLLQANDQIAYEILWVIAVFTMTFANILALVQDDVKRMLAYSSISHAGFVLAGIIISTPEAQISLFLYWILFFITNLGAFAAIHSFTSHKLSWDKRYDDPYAKYAGLVHISPITAIVMGVFMLSLAGIPPLAVYWGKIFLVSSAIEAGHLWLGFIMIINSAIAVYYYLKLVIVMFLQAPSTTLPSLNPTKISLPLKIIIGISFVLVITAVFFIDFLQNFLQITLMGGI